MEENLMPKESSMTLIGAHNVSLTNLDMLFALKEISFKILEQLRVERQDEKVKGSAGIEHDTRPILDLVGLFYDTSDDIARQINKIQENLHLISSKIG
jgi:hypothetical protein